MKETRKQIRDQRNRRKQRQFLYILYRNRSEVTTERIKRKRLQIQNK